MQTSWMILTGVAIMGFLGICGGVIQCATSKHDHCERVSLAAIAQGVEPPLRCWVP